MKKEKKNQPIPKHDNTNKNLIILAALSILAKIVVIVITTGIFHSFIDTFDLNFYYGYTTTMAQGKIPYIDIEMEYPPLIFVPIFLSLIPQALLGIQGAGAFGLVFQILMILSDIGIVVCVYYIGLKVWGNEHSAMLAGILYIASFSAAYFVITKYDAFPTMLFMAALAYTFYQKEVKGYIAATLGVFAKIFPMVAFPFLVLFNAKSTSIKREIISAATVIIPVIFLFIPVLIFRPEAIRIFVPLRMNFDYYANTLTYTIHSWLHGMFGLGLKIETVSAVMYLVMIGTLLALVYTAYKLPDKSPKLFLKLILCAIVISVVAARVRSPQYIVWYTPLICLLAVDDIKKIVLLFATQLLAFIEFPLAFGAFYTATTYTAPIMTSGWQAALILFTAMYAITFICIWFVVEPREIYRKLRGVMSD
jgi:hypothetical protein